MPPKLRNLTPAQKKRLLRLANIADKGEVGIVEEINHVEEELEDKIETGVSTVRDLLEAMKTRLTTPVIQLLGLDEAKVVTVRGKDGKNGRDGKDGKDGAPGPRGEVGPAGRDGVDGTDGNDGRDGVDGKNGKPGKDGAPGKEGSPDTPAQVRDKLETLEGDGRLDKSAIKGLEEIEKEAKKTKLTPTIFGRPALNLYVDGQKQGAIQYLNLIAGTNVTLTYSRAHGRNDITISATGTGGGLSLLAATGTVDDSNVSFTFPSAPTLVVVNGAAYRHGKGATISGTSVTLDNPVGIGGDIYGLG